MKKILIIGCFVQVLLNAINGFGQSNSALSKFSVERSQANITVFWTITAGFSCYETTVEHSVDSISFNPIYSYPGVCGSSSFDASYSYTHEYPFKNGYNYYRMNLGPFGYSDILSIRYNSFENKEYNIYPMPFNESAIIYFDNPSQDDFHFILYNTSGKIIYEKINIRADQFAIKREVCNNGLYFFQLKSSSGKVIPGRLVIN